MQCECNIIVSWYQKPCIRPAKFRVTREHLYIDGTKSYSTKLMCAVCSKREREYRAKLDNHTFYNDANLDHTYPIIVRLENIKEGVK
jgi:hypothetical protein